MKRVVVGLGRIACAKPRGLYRVVLQRVGGVNKVASHGPLNPQESGSVIAVGGSLN
jgi:hypothetical protein